MVKIGVIGCGYWGPNLIRNLALNEKTSIHTLCDTSQEKLNGISKIFPEAYATRNAEDVFKDKEIDAVVIATPAKSHYAFARKALLCGKHCLVEKPLTLNYREACLLTALAQKQEKVLMVSHTFLYNAAVRKLRQYIEKGELGKVLYLYSSRLNLGVIRRDVNALWNFGPHDISIICYLLNDTPVSLSAKGLKCIHKDLEDVVFLNLDFHKGISAHIHLSWIDPKKVRETVVVGEKKMVIYDDTSPDAKLRIFEKGFHKIKGHNTVRGCIDYGEFQLQLRDGDCLTPKIDFKEPLKEECDHFLGCIIKGKQPFTGGENGKLVVRILELAQQSLDNNSKLVKFKF
ncbi:MAG: Gfo/Idh/MocA family oxidoreductase [Candidatus Omnitrophota bacterium]